MTDLDEPKSNGWMWLAIMGMTVMFVGAILVFTENGSLPTTNFQMLPQVKAANNKGIKKLNILRRDTLA